jgi:23S rRNA pseudouridine2605 synthase/23S rRNA pseudouridine2604 synthase
VLAYRLTHPKFDHEKEYEVTVDRPIDQATCKKIAEGFMMDGSMTKPLICKKVASNRAQVILTEGKNRQIRRMFQQSGYTVKELRRMRIMTLRDDSLKVGSIRVLTELEKKNLLNSVGL